MLNGRISEQTGLAYPTEEKGSFLLPTPSRSDPDSVNLNPGKSQSSKSLEARARQGRLTGEKGHLNPVFLEEIMGCPPDWTKLEK